MSMDLDPAWRRFHFVGIGGAGMVALARVLSEAGFEVTGSDLRDSSTLNLLRLSGVKADIGHKASQVQGADVVIVSAAIPPDNAEVVAAHQAGSAVISRGEALQRVVANKRTAAVSGTHGKTTTSAMIATILEVTGQDPTYLLGADLSRRGPGGRLGGGELAVVEADEAYGSFLHLRPAVAVITNIEADHLDHYGGMEQLIAAFETFISHSENVIVCADHPLTAHIHDGAVSYGFADDADVRGFDLVTDASTAAFGLEAQGEVIERVELAIGGRHNAQNAIAALAACRLLGLDIHRAAEAIGRFTGASRRFEFRGKLDGADFVDDYAHHPTEIEATLTAARTGPWRRIVAVFQPHLYSRTRDLCDAFGLALAGADLVVVTDVYGAREAPLPGVTGKLIVEAVCDSAPGKRVVYQPRLADAASFVKGELRDGDLVLSLGAGDITSLPELLSARI
ncbi:MAG: UDP-N-acetylmuramate--L-alanine ligase [Actinomycetota bacterium]|nr:UDP-N-acetylmuramate--L-alanine ligase [Actinomycetota bacterium]